MHELDKDPPPQVTPIENVVPLPVDSSNDLTTTITDVSNDLTNTTTDTSNDESVKAEESTDNSVKTSIEVQNVEVVEPENEPNAEINSSPISSKAEENDDSSEKGSTKKENSAAHPARSRQLVRGLALCGDDDTKLSKPPPATLQKLSDSQSKDSSVTDGDCGGDLKAFLANTLHKNPRDRKTILNLEKELREFIECSNERAYKFPPMSSYNRMLLHRIAAVFGLDHNVDNSGKCIVVNKTAKTSIPDFNFSSFITHNFYSDTKQRSFENPNEVPGMNYLGYDVYLRRALSYDTPNYVPSAGSWVQQPSNHSTEAIPTEIDGWGDRTLCMKKAESFGGVSTYAYQGSVDSLAPSVRYPSNGSGTQNSQADPSEELVENLGATQLDMMNLSPRYQRTSAPPQIREATYDVPYHQRVYVPTPVVPPNQIYQAVPNNMPLNLAVHRIQHPAQMRFNQWNAIPYMIPRQYVESVDLHPMQSQYTHGPGGLLLQRPMPNPYYQAPHAVQSHPPAYDSRSFVNMPISSSRSQQGLVASVDGGYGSMTQESCRDSQITQD
ncbi:unnamed protein product [Auanema sp. JU1783]|nr:unnamed protein product [Auanema sp. JU1783]